MRYLDIAVAALIGASAVSGLVAWGPGAPDSSAHQAAARSALWDGLRAFVQKHGTVWMMNSTPGAFCAALAEASLPNATLTGSLAGHTCGVPPPGSVSVAVNFTLDGKETVLEAWSGGGE